MSQTLMESLRVRIGLTSSDTSRDDDITIVKDTSFALMGNYCDRTFPQLPPLTLEVETFTHFTGETVPLKRYPIASIASVVDDQGHAVSVFHVEQLTGLIHLDFAGVYHELVVSYQGGYDEDALPPDLLMAFYSVFDQEWQYVEGGAVGSAGEISSVTVSDVGTVRYTTSTQATTFLPTRAANLLAAYVRHLC